MMRIVRWLSADSHRRFVVSLLVAAGTFFLLPSRLTIALHLIAIWDAFAISVLLLGWLTIVATPQTDLSAHAKAQDFSRFIIFIFVVTAACAALFAVAFVIRSHHGEVRVGLTSFLILALGTVAISWLLLHTVFSFHYAHIFYGDNDDVSGAGHAAGLDFPDQPEPDYSDFGYFSFVIGMTCQVSDVQVTSQAMRRAVLLHGVLSFGYNTIILALLINTVSGLL
jgi:uncharacterized membrane protein